MKALIVSFLFAGILSFSFAAEKESKENKAADVLEIRLSGQVVDQKTQEALVGVKVVVEGTDLVSYTDFDGNYEFEHLKPGAYKLTATYISYEKATIEDAQISPKKNQVNFSLRTAD